MNTPNEPEDQNQDTPADTQTVVNALPWSVTVFVIPMILVEIYIQGAEASLWGSFSARFDMIRMIGFMPDAFETAYSSARWVPEVYMRMLTFIFIQPNFLSAIFGVVMLLAIGKFVGETLGNAACLVLILAGAVSGTLLHTYVLGSSAPLIGVFTVVYCLLGAFTWVLYLRANGDFRLRLRAFRLVTILFIINIVFMLINGLNQFWITEFASMFLGFGIAIAMGSSGLRNLLQRIRRR